MNRGRGARNPADPGSFKSGPTPGRLERAKRAYIILQPRLLDLALTGVPGLAKGCNVILIRV